MDLFRDFEAVHRQNAAVALQYHNRTKHYFHRFAASLGYLDWANQPNPYRYYHGTEAFLLPFSQEHKRARFDAVYGKAETSPAPLSVSALSHFLEVSLGLSAIKEYRGNRWALRCNPSSGNLHPTEAYLVCPPMSELVDAPTLYHYMPQEHALAIRALFPEAMLHALFPQKYAPLFYVGLASLHWREAWKYGERAYRYCQLDVGHAIAALAASAALLGWTMSPVLNVTADDIEALLCLTRDAIAGEEEHAIGLWGVFPQGGVLKEFALKVPLVREAGEIQVKGKPNRVSREHVRWEAIEQVAAACRQEKVVNGRRNTTSNLELIETPQNTLPLHPNVSARDILLRRRSALAMDGHTPMSPQVFFCLLEHLQPAYGGPLWQALVKPFHVSLVLMIHRVEGLPPGVYALLRHPAHIEEWRTIFRKDFEWSAPAVSCAPRHLYCLQRGYMRSLAETLACQQEIAADGCFSVALLASMKPLYEEGAFWYPRLHWEAGLLGHILYLEAEAHGFRGTGIGCYFDDPTHEILGIEDASWQCLYQFTVGKPIEDPRLRAEAPYSSERYKQNLNRIKL